VCSCCEYREREGNKGFGDCHFVERDLVLNLLVPKCESLCLSVVHVDSMISYILFDERAVPSGSILSALRGQNITLPLYLRNNPFAAIFLHSNRLYGIFCRRVDFKAGRTRGTQATWSTMNVVEIFLGDD
jgi:hypothetical protein